jgi:hypothetical protein
MQVGGTILRVLNQVLGQVLGLVISLWVLTVVGAIILCAAVAMFNVGESVRVSLAGRSGSPDRLPKPGTGKALTIVLVTFLVTFAVGFGIERIVAAGAVARGMSGMSSFQATLLAELISMPVVGLAVMAAMLAALLPTSFRRGILVSLCYALIVIVAVGVFMLKFGR